MFYSSEVLTMWSLNYNVTQKTTYVSLKYNATKAFKLVTKGRLNSEWSYEIIVSPKMQTKNYKDFCSTKQTRIVAKKTVYTHQKLTKKSATILVCLVGQKSL